jgi:hemerythrin
MTERDPGATLLVPRHVAWTSALAVGIDEIDAQHRELYRRIDAFLGALAEKRAREELTPLIRYLQGYVRTHFAEEQRMMEFSFYPALGDHLLEHQHFDGELERLADELQQTGPTYGLAKQLVALLVDWLDNHLVTTDRRFGTFLAAFRGQRGGPARA